MPAVQLTPPGHLELHVVVVALTPASLLLVCGACGSLIGNGRFARLLAWTGMAAAIAIEVLFLLPHGLAAAFTFPIGHGWMRVGTWQVVLSLASGIAGWLRWRPQLPERGCWGWGWRAGASLAMPLCLLPLLGLVAGCDAPISPVGPGRPLARRWRVLLGLCATVVVACTLAVDDGDRWLPRVAACLGFALISVLASDAWRVVLVLAALAALLPLPPDSALAT